MLIKEKVAKLAVIADDITGANDAGVQFKKQGFKTIVGITKENIKEMVSKADVIVINTDSRNDSPKIAYEKVRAVAKLIKETGIKIVYKKVDSTLRGNIGTELDAVMDELSAKVCIVAPAFPANGRITVGGYQLVNQVPVAETEFANDPFSPVKKSHVPTLLQSQTRRKVGHVDLLKVESGTEALMNEIANQRKRGNEIIVIDATTQHHLRIIAKAAIALNLIELTCGSAGLAEALSQEINLVTRYPVVVIAGSTNDVTRRQILKVEHDLDSCIIDVDPCEILNGVKAKHKEIKRVVEEAVRAIYNGKNVLITSARLPESLSKARAKGEELGMKNVEVAKAISSALGEIANKIVEYGKITGLILIGGSTAMDVCLTLGARGILFEDEVLPGVPCGRLVGGRHDGLKVVTKAGGFGDENAIIDIIKYLRNEL
jgi:uncharacterized protein YgbK (DUF1537 family)